MNVARLSLENIERYGEYTSIHFEGASWTNLEHSRRAGRLARVLRDRGVRAGDCVVVMMPNSPDVIAAFQAVWRLGAVIIPVTPQLGTREVRHVVEHSGAGAVLTKPELAARLREAATGLATARNILVLAGADGEDAADIEPDVRSAEPLEDVAERSDDDLALLLYTSGTTGKPKGVMLSHRNMLANPRSGAQMFRFTPRMPTLHALPLSHSYGVLMMNLGYVFGWVLVVLPSWDTRRVFESIERFRIERFGVVPTMLRYMIDFPDRPRYDTSSLVWVWSGGAPLPNDLRVEFEAIFHCRVADGYGQSEATASLSGYWEGDEPRDGAAGRALPGVELQIQDPSGAPLPARTTGEICARGENIMLGYWNDPEATAQALAGGWLHTGDIGFLDEDGFVYVTDRKKDLIIKGGENISPREIEEAIYEHPAVAEAAVVRVPHPVYGEDIWAAVVAKPAASVSEEEICSHVGRYVTKFKIPTRVIFYTELPKNGVGKILKRQIREELSRAAVEGR